MKKQRVCLGIVLWMVLPAGNGLRARPQQEPLELANLRCEYRRNPIGIDVAQDALVAPEGPPVRRIGELRPAAILRTPDGKTVLDVGQNMVGRVRLRVRGDAGTTVVLRHAEVLDKEGRFYTDNRGRF